MGNPEAGGKIASIKKLILTETPKEDDMQQVEKRVGIMNSDNKSTNPIGQKTDQTNCEMTRSHKEWTQIEERPSHTRIDQPCPRCARKEKKNDRLNDVASGSRQQQHSTDSSSECDRRTNIGNTDTRANVVHYLKHLPTIYPGRLSEFYATHPSERWQMHTPLSTETPKRGFRRHRNHPHRPNSSFTTRHVS